MKYLIQDAIGFVIMGIAFWFILAMDDKNND